MIENLTQVTNESLKSKEKSSWVIPKVVAVAYGIGRFRELFITKFKSQFKRGFIKVIITRVVARRALTVFMTTVTIKTGALPSLDTFRLL